MKDRAGNFKEVELGYDETAGQAEAEWLGLRIGGPRGGENQCECDGERCEALHLPSKTVIRF